MEVEDKLEPFNPWKVEDIDQFLNYCCPECDAKQKTKSEFIIHAIDVHPNSRNYLPLFDFEEEKEQQEHIIDPKDNTNLLVLECIEDIDEDHKLIVEPPSKNSQDHLALLDQLVTNFSDFVAKEEIIEGHESSFEPQKKKFKNDPFVKLESIELFLQSKMKCNDCGSFFVKEESLLEHKKQIHESNNSDQSEVEPETFKEDKIPTIKTKVSQKRSKVIPWIRDIDPTDGKIKFKCEDCGKFFKSRTGIQVHSETIHQKAKRNPMNPWNRDIDPTDGLTKFKCEECGKFFMTGSGILKHTTNIHPNYERKIPVNKTEKESEKPRKQYKCEDCGKILSSRLGIRKHVERMHQKGTVEETKKEIPEIKMGKKYLQVKDPKDGTLKFKCQECGMLFKSRRGISHHNKTMHPKDQEDLQQCLVCPVVIPTAKIVSHMKTNHCQDGCYTCIFCSKEFREGCDNFLFHLTKVHQIGEFRIKCDQCDRVFDKQSRLDNHIKIRHDKINSVICDKCGQECINDTSLSNHMKIVHNLYTITKKETIKKCDKCDSIFESPEEFNDHLKQCLDDLKDFKCKFCERRWVSHLSLQQHIAVDHKILRRICDICGHASQNARKLKEHQNHVHFKVYEFVCHICAKPVSGKNKLNFHMINAHGIGEKKFKCDQCDKCFAIKSILKQHYQRHHSQSSTLFRCELCPKTFRMKTDLNTHVRMIHDKIRPHKCDICQQGFYYKRDVVSHKKSQHSIHE